MNKIPKVPGWDVHNDGGVWVAHRLTPLTAYQRERGALDEMSAFDEGELWILADAQMRLSERLATAERLHQHAAPYPETRRL